MSRRLLALYLQKAHENGDEVIPWGSLKYLIGDAMYGGRVSDSFDRRVLSTYLEEYMGDFLFDEGNHFYFSRAGFDYDLVRIAGKRGGGGHAFCTTTPAPLFRSRRVPPLSTTTRAASRRSR